MLQHLIVYTLVASVVCYVLLLGGLYLLQQRFPARFLFDITEQILVMPAAGCGLAVGFLLISLFK